MSRFLPCAVLLLLAGTALAQNTAKKPPTKKPPPVQAQVAPDDMVIVITGACQTPPGEFAVRDCVRGVTRQEFEDLVAAVDPNSTPQSRQKLAEALGQIIILADEARKRGLPRDPQVHELIRLEQMRLLANLLLSRTMKQDAAISDTDVETFYQEHLRDYKQAEFLKIDIPTKDPTGEPPEQDKAFAETIRSRCSAGEDPGKLEAEADQRSGHEVTAPADLKDRRPATFPADEQGLFDLKPGECSPAFAEGHAFVVYKAVAISTIPLAEARAQIVSALQAARVKSELETLKQQHAISLNGKYFGTEPAAASNEGKAPEAPSNPPPK